MRYLKIILYIIATLLILKVIYFFSVWLMFSEPWNNIRVSEKENTADLESKHKLEILYKEKLTEALTKKDAGICNELPEQVYSYARDKEGKIFYTFLSTSGGPTGPQRLSAQIRYQCKLAYAITYLDAKSCKTFASNDIQGERCLVEVAEEMRSRNVGDIKKVCNMIRKEFTDEIRECLSPLRSQSKKSHYTNQIEWGA